jgi:RNA polymerase sigma-70 factor (ECF subfamily)
VERAVAQLPLAQRVALTMYFFEDFGYEEIAEAMGLPLNTVKSHLRRGKQRLAELLRDEAPVHGATADGSPPPRGPARGQANADSAGRPRIRPFSGMEARFRAMR